MLCGHDPGSATPASTATCTELADVLVEIANVGAGNAAGALSYLVNRPFVIGVPEVAVLRPDSLPLCPNQCAGGGIMVAQRLVGELDGHVLLVLSLDHAPALLALLSPGCPAEDLHQAFGRALLRQVAALLAAAYLAALRSFLGVRVAADLPAEVRVGSVQAELGAVAAALREPVIVLLRTAIHPPDHAEDAVACIFFVLPRASASLLEQRAHALLA